VRHEDLVAVGLLDLSGSSDGSWAAGTSAGSCREAHVSLLLDSPERWAASAAVLGDGGGRFGAVPTETVDHREGRALRCRVGLRAGWSVLRVLRPSAAPQS
jgi:hypothetical protein